MMGLLDNVGIVTPSFDDTRVCPMPPASGAALVDFSERID
jgi:hypothetical protein